jgi:hypothetical protein
MDKGLWRKFLPYVQRHDVSSFMLEGIGARVCSGWIEVQISFVGESFESQPLPIAFFLVNDITTSVIIGNDFLQPHGACIDLDDQTLKLRGLDSLIPINCFVPERIDNERVIRNKESFTILPGHEARIPASISHRPSYEYFVTIPIKSNQYGIRVARSVHRTNAPIHYVHVVNIGSKPVAFEEGFPLAGFEQINVDIAVTLSNFFRPLLQ